MGVLIGTEEAIEEIRQGRMTILVDDEDREKEGDLTMAAEKVTPEAINFMIKYGRGLVCLCMTPAKIKSLNLPFMVAQNKSRFETAFTISIEAKRGVTTGISAYDRAATILAAVDEKATSEDLVSPGHIFRLRAMSGGVLVRAGQTEGSVDLARLAGLVPAGVVCEVLNENGTMARLPDLKVMAERFGLKICTIKDLIQYRMRTETLVRRGAETALPTASGADFRLIIYENDVDNLEHIALVKGEMNPEEPILVKVHSQCLTGDVFGSRRCDCGSQLNKAMAMIEKEGQGVILYMKHESRGIGLMNKIRDAPRDKGCDNVEANLRLGFKLDLRDYGIGAQILADLGVRKMRLMTNNPKKIVGLEGYDLEVVEQVPILIEPCATNIHYIHPKQEKLGHLLNFKDNN